MAHPYTQAIADAVRQAMVPDVLVRMTFQTADQAVATMGALIDVLHAIHGDGVVCPPKTTGWPVIELPNGSGIELVLEKGA